MNPQFIPAKYLSNSHLQTLWPSLFRPRLSLVRQRERINTADADFFDVDWYGGGDKGTVVLLHGLTGSSRSHYILGLQGVLADAGYRVAAMNFRGCSGACNLTAGSYHAGFTDDIEQLYQLIADRYIDHPVFMIGFSLGGNMMLKWLAEYATSARIEAAMAVSVPYRLNVCADRIDQGFSKVYRYHLISTMKRLLASKKKFFAARGLTEPLERLNALGDLRKVSTFWQFDNQVVAALHGFNGVNDYYAKCSSISFLKDVRVKTLLINALDDPFMTSTVFPDKADLANDMRLLITDKGGHAGFIAEMGGAKPEYWLESMALNFLQGVV